MYWKALGLLFAVWLMILALQIAKVSLLFCDYSHFIETFSFTFKYFLSRKIIPYTWIYTFILTRNLKLKKKLSCLLQNYSRICSLPYWLLDFSQVSSLWILKYRPISQSAMMIIIWVWVCSKFYPTSDPSCSFSNRIPGNLPLQWTSKDCIQRRSRNQLASAQVDCL